MRLSANLTILAMALASMGAAHDPAPPPPTADFTIACEGRICKLDASMSSGGPFRKVRWTYDNVLSAKDTTLVVPRHEFTVGEHRINVSMIYVATGKTTTKTRTIVVGGIVPPPPSPRVDTIRVVTTDTVRLPARVDTIVNTVVQTRVDTIRVASAPDTIRLPAPPARVDTIRIAGPARVDTITVTITTPPRVDTVTVNVGGGGGQPILPPGVTIFDPTGAREVYFNGQMLGRLVIDNTGQVQAVRLTPNVSLKVQGLYPTQVQAIAALIAPPPSGFVP